MRLVRTVAVLACSGWLVSTTAYGAAAATAGVALGGAELPDAISYTDAGNPVPLTAGLWADTLGSSDHYFSYDRRMKDSTVHVGVIGAPAGGESDGIGVEVTTADGDSCKSDNASTSSRTQQAVIGAAVSVGPSDADDRESPCLQAATLEIQIDRGSSSGSGDLPIAIKIVEEAPAGGVADLPEAAEDVDYDVLTVDPSEDRPGASSFADAPRVDAAADGTGLATTITQGESQLWRVPVGWGEQLSATAVIPAYETEDYFNGPYVEIRIIDPLRDLLTATAPDTSTSASYATEEQQISVGTAPVRYLNRYASIGIPSVPGEFWVEVDVAAQSADSEDPPLEVPVELTLAVDGKGGGEPAYVANAPSPDGGAAPDGYDAATPFLIGADTFSAAAGDHAQAAPGAETDGWWGARRFGGVGLLIAGAACCGAGIWRLRSR